MEPLHVADREQWRNWLEAHHATAPEVWLLLAKKRSRVSTPTYEDSILEAVRFGWVDSAVRRVDDGTFACRFTPRRPGRPWSESNRARARDLLAQGLMTPAGLEVLPEDLRL